MSLPRCPVCQYDGATSVRELELHIVRHGVAEVARAIRRPDWGRCGTWRAAYPLRLAVRALARSGFA